MSLIVEDGSGLTDAESYCSVDRFDAFHTARGNAAAVALSTTVKEQRLRNATAAIQAWCAGRWSGFRRTREQALDWPRYGAEDTEGWFIRHDSIPPGLVDAVAQLAGSEDAATMEALLPSLDRGGRIKREQVGPLSTEYFDGAPSAKTRASVFVFLSRLLIPAGRTVRA